jgi:hypothetical protein
MSKFRLIDAVRNASCNDTFPDENTGASTNSSHLMAKTLGWNLLECSTEGRLVPNGVHLKISKHHNSILFAVSV